MPLFPVSLLKPETIRSILVTVALIGLAVLIGGLSWRINEIAKERDAALVTVGVQKRSLEDVTKANTDLQTTINDLVQKQKLDEATRKRVEEQLAQVNEAIQSQRRELRKLGESNATVRSYLNSPVPPELRGLYDRANAAASASSAGKNLVPVAPREASRPASSPKDQGAKP